MFYAVPMYDIFSVLKKNLHLCRKLSVAESKSSVADNAPTQNSDDTASTQNSDDTAPTQNSDDTTPTRNSDVTKLTAPTQNSDDTKLPAAVDIQVATNVSSTSG